MARLAGQWHPSTLEGPREVVLNGVSFAVPDDAEVKIVRANHFEIGHVRIGGRVVILSELGQLDESDTDATMRASAVAWRLIAAS